MVSDASKDRKVIVAVVQALYDPSPTEHFERTLQLTRDAAASGARLVVFGETWLGGYPAWLDHCPSIALWGHPPTKQAFADYRRSSLTVPGPEVDTLCQLVAELQITLVIGLSERVTAGPGNRSLYNSLLTISSSGKIVNLHRKLMPTYTERLVWGQGDAHGLRAVESDSVRLGGLICWEHFMPLARQSLHEDGEDIHVAVWPTAHEVHQLASRHYAFEGRCFVLAAGQLMRYDSFPKALECSAGGSEDELALRGGSAIVAPDGSYVIDPVFDREEILVAELDLGWIDRESMTLDVSGHYSRPDVFAFSIKDRARK